MNTSSELSIVSFGCAWGQCLIVVANSSVKFWNGNVNISINARFLCVISKKHHSLTWVAIGYILISFDR